MSEFLLAVLSLPGVFPGEADCMEALLHAGVGRLHLRKPGAGPEELEALLRRLAPRWAERLVLHGPRSRALALEYGVPNVHGAVVYRDGRGISGGGPMVDAGEGGSMARAGGGGASTVDAGGGGGSMARAGGALVRSTSVHGWEEFSRLPEGLAYAFISPLFDSISKRGYLADAGVLRLPDGALPCLPVGLGGVSGETIGLMLERGWKGAAVLGWIWEEPALAVTRFEQLQKIIADGK
jgi:thiamine-phosphate pyrophosphorylase